MKLFLSREAITRIQATAIAVIVVVAAIGVAAWYLTRPPTVAPPLKVGIFGPMTGPAAKSGLNFWDGATMALEDSREQGLVPVTIDGVSRDVEIVKVDSESDPEKAVKATEDAIERVGVEIFVTGWHSSVAMAVHEISTKHEIIHIGHMGETQFLCAKRAENPEASRYWFKGWPCPPKFAGLYAPPLLDFLEEGLWAPKTQKFVVLVEDTDFGRGWGDAIKVSLEEGLGWEMAYYDVVALLPAPEVEFYPLLEKYMAAEVSLIAFTSTASAQHAALLKQARELGSPALLIPHGMGWFPEWYDLAGEATDYTIAMDSPRTYKAEQQEWAENFEEMFGYEPSLAAGGHSYDYFMIAIKALNEAGTLDPETLRSTIIDREWPGAVENYYWPSTDELWAHYMEPRVGKGWYFYPMVQFMGGEDPIVWPPEYAVKDFVQPPWL